MVNRLIIFSINTGAVTSVCAIMALIFVSKRPSVESLILLLLSASLIFTARLCRWEMGLGRSSSLIGVPCDVVEVCAKCPREGDNDHA